MSFTKQELTGTVPAEDDLIFRLKKRAEIRRQISTRKSVQNNEPDRIADLLEAAAEELMISREKIVFLDKWVVDLLRKELEQEPNIRLSGTGCTPESLDKKC